jgi:hypothetical protein
MYKTGTKSAIADKSGVFQPMQIRVNGAFPWEVRGLQLIHRKGRK